MDRRLELFNAAKGASKGQRQPRGRPRAPAKKVRDTRSAQDDVPISAASRAAPARVDKARDLASRCALIADACRGREIVVLDIRSASSIVDFFTIVTAFSRRQASALAYDIDHEMKQRGEKKLGMEGLEDGRWILLDYGDFVVHIFSEDARAYYALDDLWGDAPRVDWSAGDGASSE